MIQMQAKEDGIAWVKLCCIHNIALRSSVNCGIHTFMANLVQNTTAEVSQ